VAVTETELRRQIAAIGETRDFPFPEPVIDALVAELGVLRAWRQYLGLTIADVAEESGLARRTIENLEGRSRPFAAAAGMLSTRRALAKGLGVPLRMLDALEIAE
jgi:DNA-binding XRE family transcriptional regulator